MKIKQLVAAVLALTALGANAGVIDFNELTNNEDYVGVNPLSSGGYTFQCADEPLPICLGAWGADSPFQADPGAAAVFVNSPAATTVMTRNGGGSFDFYSIDLADVYNQGTSVTIAFTFSYTAGGSSSSSVTLDEAIGLETFAFNQTGLDSVSWITTGGANSWNQFDNISTTAIPEPGTYALMLAGLVAVGAMIRRRQA